MKITEHEGIKEAINSPERGERMAERKRKRERKWEKEREI